MDAIFKALADPTRRALLDALRRTDGQTLTQLQEDLAMTRFGVMKHLALLEEAHLITTLRRGRFKHHYLNAAPLQEAIDRWIEPLVAGPAARGILSLKHDLEQETAMTAPSSASTAAADARPDFVLQTFIRCSLDALWDALTDADQIAAYHFLAHRVDRDGDTYSLFFADGTPMFVARTLEAQPRSRIVATFEPQWEGGGAPSRTVFLLRPEGDHCALTLEHYDLTYPVIPGTGVADGWARWAASLKTWLETGETMRLPGPGAAATD